MRQGADSQRQSQTWAETGVEDGVGSEGKMQGLVAAPLINKLEVR